MQATLYLFACALATAQAPTDSSVWSLQPHLSRGQELVYRGSYSEEARGQSVQFSRSFHLETRVFVLDTTPQNFEVAFFTTWKARAARSDARSEGDISSVRLELAQLDLQGRLKTAANVCLLPELDGPPTIECGVFVESPRGMVQAEQTWEAPDSPRPPRNWRVVGTESIGGARCIKLVGVQQSADWDKPRADRTAWRRSDTVWITPKVGYAAKVERVVERREPARKEPSQRSVLRYELESSLTFPGQLYEDRRREIQLAQSLSDILNTQLPRAGEVGPRTFEVMLKKIQFQEDQHPPTPYREALHRVQRLAEAGKRGETPPAPASPIEAEPVASVVNLGKPAPDFLVPDLLNNTSVHLRKWIGRPILLVFYHPSSASADEVLRFAQKVLESNSEQVVVLGMPISDDTNLLIKQRARLRLTFPMLSGSGLRMSYAVEATPKFVVLDAAGVVRGSYVGWGPETPHSITADLKKCHGPGE